MTQKPSGITLHYQSPTGNTKNLAIALANQLSKTQWPEDEPLSIIAVPVYAGRVPNLMLPWIKSLVGKGRKAVALVTYGGRHFDDALIELSDLLREVGFKVIGAGAFVAPHSFDANLIATRPNAVDWQQLNDFALALTKKIKYVHASFSEESLDLKSLGLGRRPYRPYLVPQDDLGQPIDFKGIKPAVDHAACTRCGLCSDACPLVSIPKDAPHTTPGKCTKCNACVKNCPVSARKFVDLGYLWHLKELRFTCCEDAPNVWTVGVTFKPLALPEDISLYEQFVKNHYKDDPHFRDYITPVIGELYHRRSAFSKRGEIQGFWIQEGNDQAPVGVVSFFVHKGYPAVLQVVFMEYHDRLDVAYAIVAAAIRQAKALGNWRITFGLCGHVNYGLGLSTTQNHRATFGAPYSKTHYAKHLSQMVKDFPHMVQKGITSYKYPWSQGGFPMTEQQIARLESRSSGKITYRPAKVHRFAFNDGDMAIYTQLNNACFTKHDFYFPRHLNEDMELFKDLRHFMVPGSLIFAYYEEEPIGFLLWYPDWSQWMTPGETLGVNTYLKLMSKGLFSKPEAFKIVEWAVVPEHAKKGIPLGLLKACKSHIQKYNFKQMYTSWILDENMNSNTFAKHWASPSEHYAAFRLDID